MKMINYNDLLAKFKPSGYVSEDANGIANTEPPRLYRRLICLSQAQA